MVCSAQKQTLQRLYHAYHAPTRTVRAWYDTRWYHAYHARTRTVCVMYLCTEVPSTSCMLLHCKLQMTACCCIASCRGWIRKCCWCEQVYTCVRARCSRVVAHRVGPPVANSGYELALVVICIATEKLVTKSCWFSNLCMWAYLWLCMRSINTIRSFSVDASVWMSDIYIYIYIYIHAYNLRTWCSEQVETTFRVFVWACMCIRSYTHGDENKRKQHSESVYTCMCTKLHKWRGSNIQRVCIRVCARSYTSGDENKRKPHSEYVYGVYVHKATHVN
jgi:hypothetical protein